MTDNSAAAAPRAMRINIGIIGCRNAGKSSLINALCGQEVAIVSPQAGTTTDAVAKPYELLPLGPVTFFDTAGLDDEGELGQQRIKATRRVLAKADLALLTVGAQGLLLADKTYVAELKELNIPFAVVFNKTDLAKPTQADLDWLAKQNVPFVCASAAKNINIDQVKQMLVSLAPTELKADPLLAGDLFAKGDIVVLVVPIDFSAPKGRLILPQVQVLREILDRGARGVIAKETELAAMLNDLKRQPALVITDSQAIKKVAAIVPPEIPLTTFSILFARAKGDLNTLCAGAKAIDNLRDGSRVLIAEACSHHVLSDDIGKVKIPNWLRQYTGKDLRFEFCQGSDFPEDLEQFSLVVHCGACMLNRTEMVHRLNECTRRGVPMANYGVVISKTQGILDRVLSPFKLK